MRKLTLLFTLLLSVSIGLSQEQRSFRIGLKAAPNLSWMKPDANGLEGTNARLKFTYGLMTEFFLSDNYAFSTGVEIMSTGGALKYNPAAFYLTGTSSTPALFFLERRDYNLQYLNFPLVMKMRTNEIGYMRYFGQFGLDASARTKAKATDHGFYTVGSDVAISNVDIADDVQFFRMALNLGLGFEYNLIGNTNLMVGITYSNGFTNALKKTSGKIMNDPNNPLQLMLHRANANFVALNLGVFF